MDGGTMKPVRGRDGWTARVRTAVVFFLAVYPSSHLAAQDSPRISETQSVLSQLVESYGVSGSEAPVRETVKRLLPSWVTTETDSAGNLWARVGPTGTPVVFVAHLDEIGFRVAAIHDDGSLELETRGGFFASLFEAQPALVHTEKGDVPGVFAPRDSVFTRHNPPPLHVDVGTTSREATEALGIKIGSTITMPKHFVRLKRPVIFVWSTREEIGLEGAKAVAATLGTTIRRVHAIDTFVSADSPLELPNFAVAPIGRGAVARSVDNSSVTPPAYVDSLVNVARAHRIALQVGTTNGGNDGSVFTPYGVVDVAIGWPLRYSHSPAEVVDLKDVTSLADIIQAVAESW